MPEFHRADARQYRQRHFCADPVDPDQGAKQVTFVLGAETIQGVGIFTHYQVGQQLDFLAGARQLVERVHGRLQFITDAIDVQGQSRRLFYHNPAV